MPSRRMVLALGLAALSPWAASAAEPATAATFVKQAGLDLATVVGGAKSPEDKQERLGRYIDRIVDQDGVARFCLGRYWQVATPAQRTEYLQLFRKVLLHGVVNRLGDYQAGSTSVTVSNPVQKPDGIYVPTVVERPDNKPVRIVWLVTVQGNDMRIADVVAEGMSLRQTQRSDYAAFLSQHGGDVATLIQALKTQVGE
jgi:phospholipid transport system substrate-binding protein